jgi:HSP20 family protein
MNTLVLRQNPAAAALSDWVDRVFGAVPFEADWEPRQERGCGLWPRTDVWEGEDGYFITVDIPGLAKEDVGINVESGVIKIEGERKEEEKKGKSRHAERAYGRFCRNFSLPEDVDTTKIEAKVLNGVLELRLPKTERARPIEIKVA